MHTAPSVMTDKIREFEWRDQDFKFLARLLNEKTGIVLTEKKKEMMYGRLVRRLRVLKMKNFDEYCQHLQGPMGEDELKFTLNAITTNTTNFFRENHHFDFLRERVLKPYRQNAQHNKTSHFRIWSAGCSSGQEPYSISMVMADVLGRTARNCKILATDIDSNMLETAQLGHYDEEKCRETIPRQYYASFTTQYKASGKGGRMMTDGLKRMITFKSLNLLHDWPMQGKFDVIFCRNVMIYFDKDTQKKLVRRFANYLKPGGILFVGHSESLLSVTDVFRCEGKTTYRVMP